MDEKKITLVIILLFFATYSQSQNSLEGLWEVWKNTSLPDSVRLKALDDIVYDGYMYSQPDSALYWSEVMFDFASEKGNKKYKAIALGNQGQSYELQGNYQKALSIFQKCFELQEELDSPNGMASSLNNMGIIYMQQGSYPIALERFLNSLKLFEKTVDKRGMANTLGNIGIIYLEQGDLAKALDYNEKSLALYEEVEDGFGVASSSINIGLAYMEQKKYTEALEFFLEGQKLFGEISNVYGSAYALKNIANVYKQTKNYSKAITVYKESLEIYISISEQNGIASSYNDLGSVYNKLSDFPEAISWCEKGLKIAQEIGVVEEQKDACECLFLANEGMGNYSRALAFHKKAKVLGDSIQVVKTSQKLQQMEFQKTMLQDSIVNAEEKRLMQEAYEEELKVKETTRNISFGIGILILLLAAGLYSRLRYVRKSKAIIESERDRSDNLLLNILPEEIAKELKEKGKADARDFDMVSILFTDFKDFTEASAQMNAADLVNEINHCFEAFDGIMEKYNIEKIKTIGDAYMAAGGLPIPTDDSVKNTVLAALEMQDFISKRKADNDSQNKPAFEMRVGIHTGPVVAGIVGVKKFQYDIWGDTVNTASRIESKGEVGKVNISQATYELFKEDSAFSFTSRGMVEAKGKGEIEMYFVNLR